MNKPRRIFVQEKKMLEAYAFGNDPAKIQNPRGLYFQFIVENMETVDALRSVLDR